MTPDTPEDDFGRQSASEFYASIERARVWLADTARPTVRGREATASGDDTVAELYGVEVMARLRALTGEPDREILAVLMVSAVEYGIFQTAAESSHRRRLTRRT